MLPQAVVEGSLCTIASCLCSYSLEKGNKSSCPVTSWMGRLRWFEIATYAHAAAVALGIVRSSQCCSCREVAGWAFGVMGAQENAE